MAAASDSPCSAMQIVKLIAARQAVRERVLGSEGTASPQTSVLTNSSTEETSEIEAVARAAERALHELDAAITRSIELSENSDPTSAEVHK